MKRLVSTVLTANLLCYANLAFAELDESILKKVSWACDNGTRVSLHQASNKPSKTDCLAVYKAVYYGVVRPGGSVVGFGADWYPQVGGRVPIHADAYLIPGSSFIAFDVLDGTKEKRRLLLNLRTNSFVFLSDRETDGSGFRLQYDAVLKGDATRYAVILRDVEGKKKGPRDKNWGPFNALRGDIGEIIDASKCTLDRPEKNCVKLRGIRPDKPDDFHRVRLLYVSEMDIPRIRLDVDIPLSYPTTISTQIDACVLYSDRDELVKGISNTWAILGYDPKSATIKNLLNASFGPKKFKAHTMVLSAVSASDGKAEKIYITELAPCDEKENYKATFVIGNADTGKAEAIAVSPMRRKQLLNNGLKLNWFVNKLIERKRFEPKIAQIIVFWLSTTKKSSRVLR